MNWNQRAFFVYLTLLCLIFFTSPLLLDKKGLRNIWILSSPFVLAKSRMLQTPSGFIQVYCNIIKALFSLVLSFWLDISAWSSSFQWYLRTSSWNGVCDKLIEWNKKRIYQWYKDKWGSWIFSVFLFLFFCLEKKIHNCPVCQQRHHHCPDADSLYCQSSRTDIELYCDLQKGLGVP